MHAGQRSMCGVIVVDAESFQSTCHGRDAYIQWSCLDILITMLNSVNCSTVIRSPTVEYVCSWEKPLVKPMALGSIFIILIFQYLVISFAIILLCIPITKIPKIFILLSLSDLTFASGREGIDNPFIALGASSWLFVQVFDDLCVVSYLIDTLVLKNWGKYLRYFAASPFPLQGKPTQCSRGSKKDFWRYCRGA